VKLKCDGWRRDNAQRWRLFEGNKKSDIAARVERAKSSSAPPRGKSRRAELDEA
jgi:hypothetical protein